MGKEKDWHWNEINLVLINGDKIALLIREDVFDEMWEGIELSLATEAVWFCGGWDSKVFKAYYLGSILNYIDFKKVIGIES